MHLEVKVFSRTLHICGSSFFSKYNHRISHALIQPALQLGQMGYILSGSLGYPELTKITRGGLIDKQNSNRNCKWQNM